MESKGRNDLAVMVRQTGRFVAPLNRAILPAQAGTHTDDALVVK
jgi:hypothetical protein